VSRSQFLDINRAGCAPPNGNAGASTWQRIFPLLSNVNVVRKVSFTTSFGLAFWSVKRCLIASRTSEELRVTDPDSRVSLTCVAVSTSSSRFGSLTTVAKSSIDPPGVRVRAGFDSGRGELWSPERHRRARCRKPAGLFLSANHASSCWYLCWYRQQYKKKFAFNSIGYGTRRLSARAPTRLFKPVQKRPQPSVQCSETLEKQAVPRTSVFVTVCSHPIPAVRFVGIFVGIGRTNVHGDFRYSERGN
jgi:hypothetical protein